MITIFKLKSYYKQCLIIFIINPYTSIAELLFRYFVDRVRWLHIDTYIL